jgi:hypothetical protein
MMSANGTDVSPLILFVLSESSSAVTNVTRTARMGFMGAGDLQIQKLGCAHHLPAYQGHANLPVSALCRLQVSILAPLIVNALWIAFLAAMHMACCIATASRRLWPMRLK